MKTAVSIVSFFAVIITVAIVIGVIAILIQFTHSLDPGYLRTFLTTVEISSVVVCVVGLIVKLAPA